MPYSFLGEDNSYQSAADAVTAINGVYDRLRSIYGMPMLILSDMNGEEMNIRPDGGANVVEIDKNTYTSANGNFDGFYTNCYLIIDRANRLLKNVPRITMNETQKGQILGEAKFLRALIYFDLVQAFGDVPLITAPTSDVVNVAIARTPATAVYAQIVKDLKEADAANLPVKYTASGEIGRATSGAVKSILAKVYLTQKDWTNAAAKAKEVIDGNAYSLFPDYKDIFPPANKNGREHIFSVQYSCVKSSYGSSMGLNFAIFFSWPIQQSGGSCRAEELFASSYYPDDYRKK
ncbi:RagB/SusD family nutrient uptake outer membrane protein [Mucilaginibacter humi]|uniref:RagB/SusD family nutrient uptake outer membrane protein n=1 Tax=Mucilaginibacter humi TaxID=2732510 RepID=UPI001C2E2C94|nr:RagB/SusD family nutrient uptake outer membrane protein [Mucilaginibacter humi]